MTPCRHEYREAETVFRRGRFYETLVCAKCGHRSTAWYSLDTRLVKAGKKPGGP